ncbi:hypothetical protein [Ancylobacter oerskovii]|uniref:Uncharacterized protein n=1 Tax=Ancylobacter oerskovii TaxID=459519 RepID=A0ABW4YX19_9HYPH|nr:hypothetical protein [Ancylobacter oerskovii]
MKTRILLLGVGLAAFATGAQAGPCTDRINSMEKSLSTTDAGSGPTQATPAPTSPPAAGVPKAGEVPGTGGTAGMNATVGNKATSPADVRAQTSGGTTAAQGGATSAKPLSDLLKQAKAADQAGDAAACTRALDEAQRLLPG